MKNCVSGGKSMGYHMRVKAKGISVARVAKLKKKKWEKKNGKSKPN